MCRVFTFGPAGEDIAEVDDPVLRVTLRDVVRPPLPEGDPAGQALLGLVVQLVWLGGGAVEGGQAKSHNAPAGPPARLQQAHFSHIGTYSTPITGFNDDIKLFD